MIQRTFIHVDGPPGAGKTTFVERLVPGARHWVLRTDRQVFDDVLGWRGRRTVGFRNANVMPRPE